MHVCTFVCMYLCMYVSMYVCMWHWCGYSRHTKACVHANLGCMDSLVHLQKVAQPCHNQPLHANIKLELCLPARNTHKGTSFLVQCEQFHKCRWCECHGPVVTRFGNCKNTTHPRILSQVQKTGIQAWMCQGLLEDVPRLARPPRGSAYNNEPGWHQ